MWYPPAVTQAPASEPVAVDAVLKARLAIDYSDHDALLAQLIEEARSRVEASTGLRLVTQTLAQKCDGFADLSHLQIGPVQSIVSIGYVDGDGQDQTLAASVYEARIDGLQAAIVLKYGQSWPSIRPGSRVTITAVVGYQTIEPALRGAILALVATWYAFREQIVAGVSLASLPDTINIDSLLCNFRLGA